MLGRLERHKGCPNHININLENLTHHLQPRAGDFRDSSHNAESDSTSCAYEVVRCGKSVGYFHSSRVWLTPPRRLPMSIIPLHTGLNTTDGQFRGVNLFKLHRVP